MTSVGGGHPNKVAVGARLLDQRQSKACEKFTSENREHQVDHRVWLYT